MAIINVLSELMGRLLDKGPDDETDTSHSKFVANIVDILKSTKDTSQGCAISELLFIWYAYVLDNF